MPPFCLSLCKSHKCKNARKLAEICKIMQKRPFMQEYRAKCDGKNKISCKKLKKTEKKCCILKINPLYCHYMEQNGSEVE